MNPINIPFIRHSFLILSCFFLCCLFGQLHGALLPSWNEGAAKQAIIEFIKEAVIQGSDNFIPVEERIVVFDQDGTLWVEQPAYVQFFFAIESIKDLAPSHPEWRDQEPFKSLLSGNPEVLKHLSEQEIAKIIAFTHSDMTIHAFHRRVAQWLKHAIHPRFKRPFTDLVYQPMLEVIQLLREHDFKIYIVSGSGQEFMRVYSSQVYGIPPEHIIGSAEKVKYEYRSDGQPVLLKLPEVLLMDNYGGKPEGINLIIGRRPVAAFGNSTGDQQMLEWTQAGKGKTLELLVHHDDAEREYAYGAHSKIGTFSHALMEEAKKRGWIIVSMKDDWKIIFPWQTARKPKINSYDQQEKLILR